MRPWNAQGDKDGPMELVVLGTGTATPSLERNASGLALHAGGIWVLVDVGPGILRRMCEAKIDWQAIDLILITHFHPDHVSDLVPFLFASNYAYDGPGVKPFHLVGPEGLEHLYKGLVGVYGHWIVPTGERLRLTELNHRSADSFLLKGVRVRSTPAVHSEPSLSYRIDADGASLVVSGDTDVSPGLVELSRGADLLVCECSLPEGRKEPGHLVPSEAGRMASEAGVGRLLLTHFYPPCDRVDVVEQAAKTFSGEIVKAADFMVITV
jgi:ribonuclease BN (tRNA processing enzyme)